MQDTGSGSCGPHCPTPKPIRHKVVIHDKPPQKHFWTVIHFVSCVALLPLLLLFFENYLPAPPRTSWNIVDTFMLLYIIGKKHEARNLRPLCPANFNLIMKSSIPGSYNFFFARLSHFSRELLKSGTWEKWHLPGVTLENSKRSGKVIGTTFLPF